MAALDPAVAALDKGLTRLWGLVERPLSLAVAGATLLVMVVLATVGHLNRNRPEGLETGDLFLSEALGQAPFTVIVVVLGVALGFLAVTVLGLLSVTRELRRPLALRRTAWGSWPRWTPCCPATGPSRCCSSWSGRRC